MAHRLARCGFDGAGNRLYAMDHYELGGRSPYGVRHGVTELVDENRQERVGVVSRLAQVRAVRPCDVALVRREERGDVSRGFFRAGAMQAVPQFRLRIAPLAEARQRSE
ncbi:MAG TPA: hypothetical protein VN224_15810, partial [Xanthomonadales bacterium]|nr:hypothetical protein [Xanthomonadales bacterium]